MLINKQRLYQQQFVLFPVVRSGPVTRPGRKIHYRLANLVHLGHTAVARHKTPTSPASFIHQPL
jgi:hypothetical protein